MFLEIETIGPDAVEAKRCRGGSSFVYQPINTRHGRALAIRALSELTRLIVLSDFDRLLEGSE
jgi:hypothetical protein